jgi:hypothetical protein
VHYNAAFSPSWEIAPYGWGDDFEDKILYLSLTPGILWGCGICSDCSDNDNNAVITRLTDNKAKVPLNTDLESM